MASATPHRFDIFEIYARYCDIVSRNDQSTSRELLNLLSKTFGSRGQTRNAICSDLFKLMSCLDLPVDSCQFSCFYDFVFFVSRENAQKNITVSRAIAGWRLVLNGRFRLLNQWCNFVEEHQRHNISEDTWQQLLAFSRCVNEDLEGYDPKGAWPVLIDDFVEHMYRITQSNNCSTRDFCCSCGNNEAPGISNAFRGFNLLLGSKRKCREDIDGRTEETSKALEISTNSDLLMRSKRLKLTSDTSKVGCWDSDLEMGAVDDVNRHNSFGCLQTSPSACAVEDSLSKGFEGHLSIGCCFQFDQKGRVSYT